MTALDRARDQLRRAIHYSSGPYGEINSLHIGGMQIEGICLCLHIKGGNERANPDFPQKLEKAIQTANYDEVRKAIQEVRNLVEHGLKEKPLIGYNAEAQLPSERPKAAEGIQSAPALWAVNCSYLLGDCIARTLPLFG